MASRGYIGVDLDRTLATHEPGDGVAVIGEPIRPMVERVQGWLQDGIDVRIVTARVSPDAKDRGKQAIMIQDWCRQHIGAVLPIQSHKCKDMVELWDDRAVTVLPNLGVPFDEIDYLIAIESDAYVTTDLKHDPGTLTVHMITGSPLDIYKMTPREASVLAARLLRAINEFDV